MNWQIDARIPVTIVEQPPALTAATALLAEEALPEGVGPPTLCAIFRAAELIAPPGGCPCCIGQGAAAAEAVSLRVLQESRCSSLAVCEQPRRV